MRKYKCLDLAAINESRFVLTPIRDEDKYPIMHWRNSQLNILRQNELLTEAQQEAYFRSVVSPLFELEQPAQLLFSFFYEDRLIGYGGLVHIDWKSGNAEISFLLEPGSNENPSIFKSAWLAYLKMISAIAFRYLAFHKIYTYAYSTRTDLFPILEKAGFVEEVRLKDQVNIDGVFKDVLIHSLFRSA
jgi:RimJ/RimL family protein N-acetyltransferase